MAKKIMVTGGSGYLGAWAVKELVGKGYDVLNVDTKRPNEPRCRTIIADLNDAGQAWGTVAETRPDAIVHLAAIPAASIHTGQVTAHTNIMTAYHVLEAAAGLGVKKVALASSDSSYGAIFSSKPYRFRYFPLDEEHPQIPEDPYGFSKLVNEQTAMMFSRKFEHMQIICLRFCLLISPERYAEFPGFNTDPQCACSPGRIRELWNYADMRDAAAACRLAVEADIPGCHCINIAGSDTCMDVPTAELIKIHYPDVTEFREPLTGFRPLTSTRKAKELLDWEAKHSWRDGKP